MAGVQYGRALPGPVRDGYPAQTPVICRGFHSYLWWESGIYSYIQEYGHGLIQRLKESPYIDFVSDITSYDDHYPGGPSATSGCRIPRPPGPVGFRAKYAMQTAGRPTTNIPQAELGPGNRPTGPNPGRSTRVSCPTRGGYRLAIACHPA
jgi:hypothetical protein